ncbi:xanthine dehydrogenase accessory factor [Hymenobacter psychrotolerans DSM 18569]|uniref:Xanthine dehydrogenase accessory factor n=2 Tax=Hymenobacter psychrotolerans TaxID=344998 RepID=A0A1M7CPP7_9BACT|nr:xanthine dehydrogenase accessory factor [Hymenobacter psychrotolerans DSM 18569]
MLVWKHAAASLRAGIPVALLCVVRSEGSSPGRQGFKMSVTATGLAGSIGGGIMEHKLVELARAWLRESNYTPEIRRQVHRAHARTDRSGMICSGEQEILLLPLRPEHLPSVEACKRALRQSGGFRWVVTAADGPRVVADTDAGAPLSRYQPGENWLYEEKMGFRDHLTIVGGGHVGLALSRVLSTLDFEITVFDDRPALNTHLLNPYAHHKRIVSYDQLAQEVPQGPYQYVVIMTVGYRTDAIALRQLLHHQVRYLGVLGSSSKISHLLQELQAAGTDEAALGRVHAPIGLPIHSRTPEEIAISIAAELIRVRNGVAGDKVNGKW